MSYAKTETIPIINTIYHEMLKNKSNTTMSRDIMESSLEILKITGIETSRIPLCNYKLRDALRHVAQMHLVNNLKGFYRIFSFHQS